VDGGLESGARASTLCPTFLRIPGLGKQLATSSWVYYARLGATMSASFGAGLGTRIDASIGASLGASIGVGTNNWLHYSNGLWLQPLEGDASRQWTMKMCPKPPKAHVHLMHPRPIQQS